MASGATKQRISEIPDQALPISPPDESGKKRKRVKSPNSASDPEDERRKRRVKPAREISSPDPTSNLPIVKVPPEFSDANNTQTVRFSPGAIIAMRLVDFQVSRDATYRFEPHLNMILGSNGSGKSTVVTAMFLLFQGRVRDLERSTYGEFVTFGKDRAVLSAVIRAKGGRPSHVVAMVIPATKKSGRIQPPQWYIDSQTVSEADFAQFVASYRIQVNNLSQFLPQSRIASFAGLSPEDRLKSIEEAVGYDGMVDDHNLLANRGQELVEIDRDVDLYQKRLDDLQQRQVDIEGRISQLGSMHKEKDHLDYLNQVLKLAEYRAVEGDLTELRESLDEAREHLRNFDSEHANVRDEIAGASAKITELEVSFQSAADSFRDIERVFDDHQAHGRSARENLKLCVNTIKDLQKESHERTRKIEQVDKEHRESLVVIARGRKSLNEMGDTELFAQRENALAALQERHDEALKNRRDLSDEQEQIQASLSKLKSQLQRSVSQLRSLETAQKQERPLREIQQIVPWDRGMLEKAVRFVRHHHDRFRLPIIEPAIISVDITDQRLLPMIARVIPISQMFKFICQCREDMTTLTNLAANAEDIDIKAALLDEKPPDLPEKAVQALKRTGFDGVLSDALSGPTPIVNFLSSLALGHTPYSLSSCSEASRRELKSLTPQFRGFIDPQMHYSFLQSRYGRHMETEASQSVGTAPKWAVFMLRRDTTVEENSLKDAIRRLQENISRLNTQFEVVRSNLEDTNKVENQIRVEMVDLISAVKTVQRTQLRLDQNIKRERELSKELHALKSKNKEHTDKSSVLINELITAIAEVSKKQLSFEELCQLLEYSHKRDVFDTSKRDLENKKKYLLAALNAKRQSCVTRIAELESELSVRRQATQNQHYQAEEATSWLRAKKKLQEGVKLANETPLADLQAEIGRRQSLLDMRDAQGESLAVVKQKLNNVVMEVQDLEQKLVISTRRRQNVSNEVDSTRAKWEFALNAMVEKSSLMFTKMFQQLQCKGSVSISKPDALAVGTWGLDVNVAFREGEQEQKLSRNRQSGGERSVTTAVYLMSLQRMTRAPFRVLDEINQGMDKHNETKTMAFIVDNSCNRAEENQSQQYFVVTPKLLFNMPYHRRMSVNFIISSEQIERSEDLPLPSMMQQNLEKLIEEEALSD